MNRNEVNQTVQTAITNSMDSHAAALDTESTDNTINGREVKIYAGSISPEGVVNMFNFDGMDMTQAFKELLDNSTDWRRPHNKLNIYFIVNNKDELIYCDNGQGMTAKQLVCAFCLFNENQDAGGNPTGKCGYGLKSALRKLSNCGKHTIITSTDGVTYLTQKSDWSNVKVMEGAFPIYDSDQSEIEEHKNYIKEGSGTLIKVKLNSDITELLNNQFTEHMKIGNIKDHFSFAYGKIPDIDIFYIYKTHPEKKIKFYNPVGLSDDNYLFRMDGHKTTELTISIYPSGHEVISWYDPKRRVYGYFYKKNRNMDKSPTFCENETYLPPPNTIDSIKPDTIKVEFTTVCLKPSDDYFDMNNPKIPENTGLSCNSDYKNEFFGDNISDDLNGTMSVNRNGSNIGLVKLTKRAQTGGAGSAKQKLKRVHMEKELGFRASPNHNDISDIFMAVNKTKHNYKLPVRAEMLRRVCEHLADEHGDYLWEMIEQTVKAKEDEDGDGGEDDGGQGGDDGEDNDGEDDDGGDDCEDDDGGEGGDGGEDDDGGDGGDDGEDDDGQDDDGEDNDGEDDDGGEGGDDGGDGGEGGDDSEPDTEGVEETKDEDGDVNDVISMTSDDQEYYENIEKQKIYIDKLNEQQKKDYDELSDYEKEMVMYIDDSAKMKKYLGV